MYGNNPFIMPNNFNPMPIPPMTNNMLRTAPIMNNMIRTTPMLNNFGARRGLSSLLGLGKGANILPSTSSFNLGNFLNGASKTLGVVKEAIPVVKEVGPMLGNMRQMMKIASIFKDETEVSNENISKKETTTPNKLTKEKDTTISSTTTNYQSNDNEPNFFI